MSLLDGLFSVILDQVEKKEKEINKYSRTNSQMSEEQKEKMEQTLQRMKKIKEAAMCKQNEINEINSTFIGGKTVAQWDNCWKSIGKLVDADLSLYNHYVGLYRHKIHGKVIYIGRAIELYNGGFRKRLSDYRRLNDSARKHLSGQIINSQLDKIRTDILIVGDTPSAVEDTIELEKAMIKKYKSKMELINVQHNR